MKFAIEALGIHEAGGGRASILTLLNALKDLGEDHRFLVFLSRREPSLETPAGIVTQCIAPVDNRFLLRLWAQLVIPPLTREYDLVHFAKNMSVFGLKAPAVVTIHDLTTLIHPELLPRADVWYWRYVQKYTMRQASRVIAVSQTTAADILKFYSVPPERVQVIYNAVRPFFQPCGDGEIARIRHKFDLQSDYLLHVGRMDAKKNLSFLVRAFDLFLQKTQSDARLVIVGEVYQKSPDPELMPTIERLGLQERVLFTGWVPDEDLPGLYSGAFAAVYPSHHEGFGIAQVEAMACGTPLIAHSAGAVSEVVGEAAIILDTLEEERFANAITRLASDAELRANLVRKGLERAQQFRGETLGRQTLDLYREVAGQ